MRLARLTHQSGNTRFKFTRRFIFPVKPVTTYEMFSSASSQGLESSDEDRISRERTVLQSRVSQVQTFEFKQCMSIESESVEALKYF